MPSISRMSGSASSTLGRMVGQVLATSSQVQPNILAWICSYLLHGPLQWYYDVPIMVDWINYCFILLHRLQEKQQNINLQTCLTSMVHLMDPPHWPLFSGKLHTCSINLHRPSYTDDDSIVCGTSQEPDPCTSHSHNYRCHTCFSYCRYATSVTWPGDWDLSCWLSVTQRHQHHWLPSHTRGAQNNTWCYPGYVCYLDHCSYWAIGRTGSQAAKICRWVVQEPCTGMSFK